MAIDDEEKRKSVSGIVTPNASKDEDWRRQVAGVYSFGDGEEAPGGPGGVSFSPSCSPLIRASFSPTHPPSLLMGG